VVKNPIFHIAKARVAGSNPVSRSIYSTSYSNYLLLFITDCNQNAVRLVQHIDCLS